MLLYRSVIICRCLMKSSSDAQLALDTVLLLRLKLVDILTTGCFNYSLDVPCERMLIVLRTDLQGNFSDVVTRRPG